MRDRCDRSPDTGAHLWRPFTRAQLASAAAVLLLVADCVSAGGSVPGGAGVPTTDSVEARPDGPPFLNVIEENVEIPMRDGVTLGATMLRPDAPGTFPTLVYRTPYGKDSYQTQKEFPRKAAQQGFLVFLVDVRGRYTSGGTFRAYRQEKNDGFDTVEWAGAHERSNGRVGTWGYSYPGYVQWLALSQNPGHLATAIPTMTPTSSHHVFFQGGAFYVSFMEWFHGSILPDLRRQAGDRSATWDKEESRTQWAAERMRWYAHRPLVDIPHMRPHATFFYDWMTHPDETNWWDFADVEDDFDKMRVPVLLVSGWYDSTYGPVGAMRGFNGMRDRAATAEARENTRLILGPWIHSSLNAHSTTAYDRSFGTNAGIDFDAIRLRWFERWVAGIDNGIDEQPPVRIFVMGENVWRSENEFPLERAQPTNLYLHADPAGDPKAGILTFTASEANESATRYVFDPRDPVWDPFFFTGSYDRSPLQARDDVLAFTSEPLSADLEVTGEVLARLFVSSDARDTDFTVTLCDVYPDGSAHSVTGTEAGYLRMRYREGFDHQVLMEPGEVYEIEVGSLLTSNLFKRGHRIQILITSSHAPHFDVNPNTGEEIATETQLVPARQTLHHDRSRPSRIILPIIPRQ